MNLAQILKPLKKSQREDALWLLQARCNCTRSQLLLRSHEELDTKIIRQFKKDWPRRQKGEPLQYIVGSAPFYGREFFVKKGVLIPRPETESLLEIALDYLKEKGGARVLDIGTGSGVLAISIKLEKRDTFVVASDISPTALWVARKNAKLTGAEIRFVKANYFSDGLANEAWDLVVSNPPYLDFRKDKIAKDVKIWEPRLALEPKGKGRDLAPLAGEQILQQSSEANVGATFLELSPRVASNLERKWKKHPRVESVQRTADLAGRMRFLLVVWKNA